MILIKKKKKLKGVVEEQTVSSVFELIDSGPFYATEKLQKILCPFFRLCVERPSDMQKARRIQWTMPWHHPAGIQASRIPHPASIGSASGSGIRIYRARVGDGSTADQQQIRLLVSYITRLESGKKTGYNVISETCEEQIGCIFPRQAVARRAVPGDGFRYPHRCQDTGFREIC